MNCASGSTEASDWVCWVGKEACDLVSMAIMNDALLGKHRSIGAVCLLVMKLLPIGLAEKRVVW